MTMIVSLLSVSSVIDKSLLTLKLFKQFSLKPWSTADPRTHRLWPASSSWCPPNPTSPQITSPAALWCRPAPAAGRTWSILKVRMRNNPKSFSVFHLTLRNPVRMLLLFDHKMRRSPDWRCVSVMFSRVSTLTVLLCCHPTEIRRVTSESKFSQNLVLGDSFSRNSYICAWTCWDFTGSRLALI